MLRIFSVVSLVVFTAFGFSQSGENKVFRLDSIDNLMIGEGDNHLGADTRMQWVYNEEGEVDSLIFKRPDDTGNWKISGYYTFIYDENLMPYECFLYMMNTDLKIWEISGRYEATYDNHGGMLTFDYYRGEETDANEKDKYETDYDGAGRLIAQKKSRWSFDTNEWKAENLKRYVYNTQGKPDSLVRSSYMNSGELGTTYVKVFIYDDLGYLEKEENYDLSSLNTNAQWGYEYDNDEFGNDLISEYSGYNDSSRSVTIYDETISFDNVLFPSDKIGPFTDGYMGYEELPSHVPFFSEQFDKENEQWVKSGEIHYYYSGAAVANIENIEGGRIDFYPNPTYSMVTFSQEIENVKLFSIEGVLLNEVYHVESINLEMLKSGIYLIEYSSKGKESIGRVIKN